MAMSSFVAQIRRPGVSDANMSKHAVNRFIEFIVLGSSVRLRVAVYKNLIGRGARHCFRYAEYPKVRAFALAPGVVRTRLSVEAGATDFPDKVALPAATTLYLTSGRADWLSGRSVDVHCRPGAHAHLDPARYYSANWDITEVERDWKDAILKGGGLVNKLDIPKL